VFRDRIRALERVHEDQKVFSTTAVDEDVIAFARRDGEALVQVFFIRGGKLLGSEHYMLENSTDSADSEILGGFIEQFYDEATYVPPKLLLQSEVSDADIIQSWLRVKRGSKVAITVPRRGEKRDLVEMASKNAVETLEQLRLRWLSDEQKATAGLTELQKVLNLPAWPQRIECYDVAHLQGTDTAGAMVVFEQGTPQKKEYRRFAIKTSGNNDYMSMKEMLTRRFRRAGVEQAEAGRMAALSAARAGDKSEPAPGDSHEAIAQIESEQAQNLPELGDTVSELVAKDRQADGYNEPVLDKDTTNWGGWSVLPDLVVIDGGKGQLSAAQEVMREVGLLDVPMISLAKREEEVFLPGRSDPIILARRSEALHLLQRVRDEAHRFSNSYNKKMGAKRATKGRLDGVAGIGPKRKKALMKQYGSIKAIREAPIEELAKIPGMDRAAAQSLKENL
jgi:excinuclease ABC subunit C